MYYRIETPDGNGPFSKGLSKYYDITRWMDNLIKPMTYHTKHPETKTKSWFTEEGYSKYKPYIEEMLNAKPNELKLVTTNTLNNIVAKGKIQVLELRKNE